MLNDWLEVSVCETERITFINAECGDESVDRLSYRDSLFRQHSIILGSLDRPLLADEFEDRQALQE